MANTGILTRKVTRKEVNGLEIDLPAGSLVFYFSGCTYGCLMDSEVAVILEREKDAKFYGFPRDSIIWD